LSVVAVPANTTRCGGKVGDAAGAAELPGAPEGPGVTPEGSADAVGVAVTRPLGAADALTGIAVGGGGALGLGVGVGGGVAVSSSAAASRNVLSLVPEL
jgi:hypothetical protein